MLHGYVPGMSVEVATKIASCMPHLVTLRLSAENNRALKLIENTEAVLKTFAAKCDWLRTIYLQDIWERKKAVRKLSLPMHDITYQGLRKGFVEYLASNHNISLQNRIDYALDFWLSKKDIELRTKAWKRN